MNQTVIPVVAASNRYYASSKVADHSVVASRSLAGLCDAIGTNQATIVLRHSRNSEKTEYVVGANLDLSAYTNITFQFERGAVLSHGAFTLNIPNVEAGRYQIFNGTGAVTLSGTVYPEWFGALRDGTTDDSTPMQAAFNSISSGGEVSLTSGTYKGEVTLDDVYNYHAFGASPGLGKYRITGLGAGSTRWMAVTAGNFALTITGTTGWAFPWKISGITFDGNENTSSGISVNASGVIGLYLENVGFWRCIYGYKNVGALWYTMMMCTFERNDYGVWIKPLSTMHGGCAKFYDCNFYVHELAAVYVDGRTSTAASEQIEFIGGINEGNYGYAFFVKNWRTSWKFLIQNIYFELNGMSDSIEIDGDTYSPVEQSYFKDSRGIVFDRCKLSGNITLVNSSAETRDCFLYVSNNHDTTPDVLFNMDSGSSGIHYSPLIDGSAVYAGDQVMYGGATPTNFEIGTIRRLFFRTPLMGVLDYDRTNLWPYGSMSVDFTPSTINGLTYSFETGDSPYFKRNLSVTIPQCAVYSNGMRLWNISQTVADDIYVFSIDIKSETNAANLRLIQIDPMGTMLSTGTQSFQTITSEYRRYYGITRAQYNNSSPSYGVWIYNPDAITATYKIANMQLVRFDSTDIDGALRFIREGRYAASGLSDRMLGASSIIYGTASPTSGLWRRGSIVYTTTPAIASAAGWVCVFRFDTTLDGGEPSSEDEMVVVASTDALDGDIIGVTLNTGVIHWTTIASGQGTTTLTLTDALTGAAASGNAVYILRWGALPNIA